MCKGVSLVNFTASVNVIVKTTCSRLERSNTLWFVLMGKLTVGLIMIGNGIQICVRANCDYDHGVMVVKRRERQSVSKQAAQEFHSERCSLNWTRWESETVSGSSVKQVRPSSENLDDRGDINRAWENIIENVKTLGWESSSLWTGLSTQGFVKSIQNLKIKRGMLNQCLQESLQIKADNLNIVRLVN